MTEIPSVMRTRWKSGQMVGGASPVLRMYVRRGRFRRGYVDWDNYGGGMENVLVPEENHNHAWIAKWQGLVNNSGEDLDPRMIDHRWHFEPWQEVTGVLEFTVEQGFDANGIQRATIAVENSELLERAAVQGGIYHAIDRGGRSPWRGYVPPGVPNEQDRSQWFGRLINNTEIRVDQGYGEDTLHTTFKGLLDDVDLTSVPGRMTITARDFGQQFTDCHMFGFNTSQQLNDPVIFADRYKAESRTPVGTSSESDCSSFRRGYPAKNVTDEEMLSAWESEGRDVPAATEWVQIRLPRGRYRAFTLHALAPGQVAFISIRAAAGSRRNGELVQGWIDGLGEVPGGNGGIPYVRRLAGTTATKKNYRLDAEYVLAADSILRVSFRNLHLMETERYHASVRTLRAIKVARTAEALKRKWVVVDDVADVVRVLLRWAGFQEWRVESTGTRMKDNLVTNRGDFYIDVIRRCCDVTGYEFFMGDPTGPDSLGVPTFRQTTALRERNAPGPTGRPKPTRTIRDTDLLTGLSVKYTDEPLSYIIRARGARATKEKGGKLLEGGAGGLDPRRRMFVYRPPWTTRESMAGQIKHVIHYDNNLKTDVDCEVACYLIALAEALQASTAVATIPALPEFELDDHVWLYDTAAGVQTRMWVAQRSHTMTTGEDAKWIMTLSGSLIDTPDIVDVKARIIRRRNEGLEVPQTNSGLVGVVVDVDAGLGGTPPLVGQVVDTVAGLPSGVYIDPVTGGIVGPTEPRVDPVTGGVPAR